MKQITRFQGRQRKDNKGCTEDCGISVGCSSLVVEEMERVASCGYQNNISQLITIKFETEWHSLGSKPDAIKATCHPNIDHSIKEATFLIASAFSNVKGWRRFPPTILWLLLIWRTRLIKSRVGCSLPKRITYSRCTVNRTMITVDYKTPTTCSKRGGV